MKWEEIDYFLEKIVFNNDLNILDIGCGNGRLLEQSSQQYDINKIHYTGIDLSENMLACAKENFPDKEFLNLNMLELEKVLLPPCSGEGVRIEERGFASVKKFNYIFFIASFHHLQSVKEREKVLQKAYNLLKDGGRIYMTNWALNSKINDKKYNPSVIHDSKNKYGSTDYNIVFGENDRYYHCFNLKELEYLAEKSGFKIIENRLFDSQKNFITILEK